jgi:hypothetical protein
MYKQVALRRTERQDIHLGSCPHEPKAVQLPVIKKSIAEFL